VSHNNLLGGEEGRKRLSLWVKRRGDVQKNCYAINQVRLSQKKKKRRGGGRGGDTPKLFWRSHPEGGRGKKRKGSNLLPLLKKKILCLNHGGGARQPALSLSQEKEKKEDRRRTNGQRRRKGEKDHSSNSAQESETLLSSTKKKREVIFYACEGERRGKRGASLLSARWEGGRGEDWESFIYLRTEEKKGEEEGLTFLLHLFDKEINSFLSLGGRGGGGEAGKPWVGASPLRRGAIAKGKEMRREKEAAHSSFRAFPLQSGKGEKRSRGEWMPDRPRSQRKGGRKEKEKKKEGTPFRHFSLPLAPGEEGKTAHPMSTKKKGKAAPSVLTC